MTKKLVQTRIEVEIKEKLKILARNNGLSLSSLLRLIINGVVNTDGLILKKLIVGKTDNKIIKLN